MRIQKLVGVVLLVTTAMLALTACREAGPKTVRLGFLSCVTGDLALWGRNEVNGAKLAVEEINKAGGVLGKEIELFVGDTRNTAADGVNSVRKLIEQDKVIAVLGSNSSGINIACNPIIQSAKVPQVGTFSSNPRVTVDEQGNVRPYMFRLTFIDSYVGKVLANYMYNRLGLKTAAILYEVGSDFSVGLTEFFVQSLEEIGGEVVAKLGFKTGDVDFRPQLSEIKLKNPDVLLLPSQYKEIALGAKQARELGMDDVVIMGPDAGSLSMIAMAREELQGAYCTGYFSWLDAKQAAFMEKYKARYNETPEPHASISYDAVYFIVDAIKRAGVPEGPAIRDALESAKGVQLNIGSVTIDPKTHNPVDLPVAVLQIEGDDFNLVEMYSPKNP